VISILIPVKNGGADLVRCLEGIAAQEIEEEVEVVVVDSGSTDGSPDRARELGAIVHEIPAEEFVHGATRNLAARKSRGDVLVFTTQDAVPADNTWLRNLVGALHGDKVAGAYGRQLPHEDARPPEQFFLEFMYGPTPRVQRLSHEAELSFEQTLFSNVNSAIPRAVWEANPFEDDVTMSEDQVWSRRMLLAGYAIVYEPRAAVRHSHTYTLGGAFRRFYASGASADRAYVAGGESRAALRRAMRRYAAGELRWLWQSGRRRWIPYAAVYELAKVAGLQLGLRRRRRPAGRAQAARTSAPGNGDSERA
jgi:rhamnosyltransferase